MPETPFYAKAMRGASHLVGHWLLLGQASPQRLAMILADTARVAKLGEPEETPNGDALEAWGRGAQPRLSNHAWKAGGRNVCPESSGACSDCSVTPAR